MATHEPMIKEDELDFNLFIQSFADKPHPFYIMYDELADEFIIKLTKTNSPSTVYYIDNNRAYLINLDDNQVIGIIYFNFTTKFLPRFKGLVEIWYKNNLANKFKSYVACQHTPEKKFNQSNKRFFDSTSKSVIRELVYCNE